MKKVAIIGGGIVGSVSAFYLARAGCEVTLYDDAQGQATKAAVGIICPWVSQRRNKWWYQLVDEGSIFYHQLIRDLDDTRFYEKSGALLVNDARLEKMYELALSRRHEHSIMGNVEIISGARLAELLPEGSVSSKALFIEGAARVDGALLTETLLAKAKDYGLVVKEQKVSFSYEAGIFKIENESFDSLVLAAGAWLADLLPGYSVDVRPQKGQLIEFHQLVEPKNYPLYIPKGEIDLLYKNDGTLVVGASHNDEGGFDLSEDLSVSKHLQSEASKYLPSLQGVKHSNVRVGTRAYTSDFLPFYGSIETMPSCFVASGLGSSGLTSGPIIGYRLAQQVLGTLEAESTKNYIRHLENIL